MSKEIKLVFKYYAHNIEREEGRKEYMLFDGGGGFKIYSPAGVLIGKSITKGIAMDMARAHHKGSTGKGNDEEYIKFFKANFINKHDPTQNVSRETFTELELRTSEEEKKEKVRLSKLYRKELNKND